jgi:hypothetical protein
METRSETIAHPVCPAPKAAVISRPRTGTVDLTFSASNAEWEGVIEGVEVGATANEMNANAPRFSNRSDAPNGKSRYDAVGSSKAPVGFSPCIGTINLVCDCCCLGGMSMFITSKYPAILSSSTNGLEFVIRNWQPQEE